MATPLEKLELAESQLERVLSSLDPPDWASLSHFGFHSTENAVDAACIHVGIRIQKTHYARVSAASQLHKEHALQDVSALRADLSEVRKSEAYGDVPAPKLDAEDTATLIEEYVRSVRELIET